MKQGKYQRTPARRRSNAGTKLGLILLAVTMLIGSTIGGTFAYLMDEETVTNTFTVGNVGTLTLTETDTDKETAGEQHEYLIVPGVDITKDPKITYNAEVEGKTVKNIAAYVFVKVDAPSWTNTNGTYSIAEGKVTWSVDENWESMGDGVYCYKGTGTNNCVPADTSLTDIPVIKDNKITVLNTITKADVPAVAQAAGSITFTAYAIQADGFKDAAAAWSVIGTN